jgi:hypothetical protein
MLAGHDDERRSPPSPGQEQSRPRGRVPSTRALRSRGRPRRPRRRLLVGCRRDRGRRWWSRRGRRGGNWRRGGDRRQHHHWRTELLGVRGYGLDDRRGFLSRSLRKRRDVRADVRDDGRAVHFHVDRSRRRQRGILRPAHPTRAVRCGLELQPHPRRGARDLAHTAHGRVLRRHAERRLLLRNRHRRARTTSTSAAVRPRTRKASSTSTPAFRVGTRAAPYTSISAST